jgi:TonB-dependent receptor-like protein
MPALADAPNGLSLSAGGASALERWDLTASSAKSAWDPTDPRAGLFGESTRASLAFDWQRNLPASRLRGSAFAAGSDAETEGRFELRDRRTSIGGTLGWNDSGRVIAARVAAQTRHADFANLRDDTLRQYGGGLTIAQEFALASRVRATASLRYDGYDIGVQSALAGYSGEASGTVVSPHASIVANLGNGTEAFVTMGRGLKPDDPRMPAAMIDPRGGVPVGRLDPVATVEARQVGLRQRWPLGISTTLSLFRMKSGTELFLAGETGFTEYDRPTTRQGAQIAARFEPSSLFALDFQASSVRARFADGEREYVPGAVEHNLTAAATLQPAKGWTTSVLANRLGSPGNGNTYLSARLAHEISKKTRVSLDVFNMLDRRPGNIDYFSASSIWTQPGADSYLFNPVEARGFRLRLRTTF